MKISIITADELKAFDKKLEEILKQLKYLVPESDKKTEKWIDSKEAKTMLHVTLPTLHKWKMEGKLAFSKIGRRVLFRLSDIEDMLERNCHGHSLSSEKGK